MGRLTAREILARVWAYYCNKGTFTAGFEQRHYFGPGQVSASMGTVRYTRPGRFVFRREGGGWLVVSDGEFVQGYDEANRQMYQRSASTSQHAVALGHLSGDFRPTAKARKLNSSRMKYESGHVVELIPRVPSPAYSKMLLYVDAETFQVPRVMLLDRYGTRNRFKFMDPEYNADIPDSEFVLNVPDDTKVVWPWE